MKEGEDDLRAPATSAIQGWRPSVGLISAKRRSSTHPSSRRTRAGSTYGVSPAVVETARAAPSPSSRPPSRHRPAGLATAEAPAASFRSPSPSKPDAARHAFMTAAGTPLSRKRPRSQDNQDEEEGRRFMPMEGGRSPPDHMMPVIALQTAMAASPQPVHLAPACAPSEAVAVDAASPVNKTESAARVGADGGLDPGRRQAMLRFLDQELDGKTGPIGMLELPLRSVHGRGGGWSR